MLGMTWQFPRNLTNAPIGPRDRGIEHYTGRRFDSLVRETIQNSLDAQNKDAQNPAKVEFQLTELEVAQFNGLELAMAIDASIAGLKPEDEAYRKMFGKAAAQLRQDTIPTLVITDSNTTGVLDDGNDNSPWAALTRGSGESAKQGNNASGSYGIGKAAAYLATDLRTVLYTTAFAVNGHLESRFIGRAILSGHKNPQGEKVTSEGYLGGPDFASLHNGDIPATYRLQQPGLCLLIPGYQAAKDWPERVVKIAIANFFHAIVKGELEVAVADWTISAKTVGGYANLPSVPVRERHLLNTSGKIPAAKSCIDGIGEVALRITLHDAGDGNIYDVALVRDAGMMITRQRSKMGPAYISIPRHWHRFTAVVECRSDPTGKSAVRDCESPKHDELDIDRIPNDEDRGPALKALRELRDWMKEEIRKQAEPVSNTEPVNATEAAELLPIRELNNNPNRSPRPSGDSISEPVQRGTSAPSNRVLPPPPPPREPKPPRPPRPPMPPREQVIPQSDALAKAKFRIGGKGGDSHGLTVQIPPFAKRISNVQIQAVTEHGSGIAMKIARVWHNGKQLKVSKGGKIAGIAPNGGNPVTLEIYLQEPVAGRRFRIRTARE